MPDRTVRTFRIGVAVTPPSGWCSLTALIAAGWLNARARHDFAATVRPLPGAVSQGPWHEHAGATYADMVPLHPNPPISPRQPAVSTTAAGVGGWCCAPMSEAALDSVPPPPMLARPRAARRYQARCATHRRPARSFCVAASKASTSASSSPRDRSCQVRLLLSVCELGAMSCSICVRLLPGVGRPPAVRRDL